MATNLQFIQSTSASGVSSMNMSNCFGSSYNNYFLTITEYVPSGGLNLNLRLIDSGGSVISASEYERAFLDMLSNSSFSESGSTAQNLFNVLNFNSGHDEGTGANATIYNPFNSSAFTYCTAETSDYSSVGRGRKLVMVHKSAEQITGLNFFTSSGTFDCTAKIFGIA